MARAVSPSLLEQWKELYDCWNRGDFEEMLAMYAEDAVFDVSAVFVDIAPARGHGNIRRCWDELYASLDGVRIQPVEVESFGSGCYVAHIRLWGKGRRSGVQVDQRFGYLAIFRPRDGKCICSRLLPDVATATAVGRESAGSAAAPSRV